MLISQWKIQLTTPYKVKLSYYPTKVIVGSKRIFLNQCVHFGHWALAYALHPNNYNNIVVTVAFLPLVYRSSTSDIREYKNVLICGLTMSNHKPHNSIFCFENLQYGY